MFHGLYMNNLSAGVKIEAKLRTYKMPPLAGTKHGDDMQVCAQVCCLLP